MRRIYLDYNAACPLDPRVEEAYCSALREGWANPGSIHHEGQAARALLAESRERVARAFSVSPQQILFFSCATEALNTLIQGLVLGERGHIITSAVEHAAVWECCRFLERQGIDVTYLDVGTHGAPQVAAVESAIRDTTKAIVLMSVNNETGITTNIEQLSSLAANYKIPFITDAVAQLGKAPFSFYEGMTAACFSGYKVYGPCGVGFAVIQNGLLFRPLLYGGGQESGKRSGSESVAAIYATSLAVEFAHNELKDNMVLMEQCRTRFEQRILSSLPNVFVNGDGDRVVNTSNLAFSGVNGEELLIQLDLGGVSASHGAACSAGSMEPSRILLKMGYPRDRVKSSVRFSFGKSSTEEEAELAAQRVIEIVHRMRHL